MVRNTISISVITASLMLLSCFVVINAQPSLSPAKEKCGEVKAGEVVIRENTDVVTLAVTVTDSVTTAAGSALKRPGKRICL